MSQSWEKLREKFQAEGTGKRSEGRRASIKKKF